jgi:hypothetical protein
MKTITICDKEYVVNSNAYTRFLYKQTFNTKIFADIAILNKFNQGQEKLTKELKAKKLKEEEINAEITTYIMENVDDFMDVMLKLAYIFIKTANADFMSFEDWLKEIETINVNDSWIGEVTELAVSSFC